MILLPFPLLHHYLYRYGKPLLYIPRESFLFAVASIAASITILLQDAQLERLQNAREQELTYTQQKDEHMLNTKARENELEIIRFKQMVEAIGPETIRAISTAGSRNNVKMLRALGLSTALITDGSSPINLLDTAHGLIGGASNVTSKLTLKGHGTPTIATTTIRGDQSDVEWDA